MVADVLYTNTQLPTKKVGIGNGVTMKATVFPVRQVTVKRELVAQFCRRVACDHGPGWCSRAGSDSSLGDHKKAEVDDA